MLKWVFGADTGPYRSALHQMRKETASFANSMGSQLVAAFGFATIVAGFKKAISAASDLGETMSKSLAVFEGKSGDVQKWSQGLAKSFGQSTASALAAATDFGAVFRVMGIGGDQAAEMSMKLVELASDMASFNNTSVEQALEAIGAGLRGESEPLRKYAVLLDDATLRAKALAMGIYDGKGPLTINQKLMSSYQAILTQTSLAQGDFAKTADGAANSQRILAAQTENAAAAMGGKLLPQWEAFLDMMKNLDVGPVAEGVGSIADVAIKSLRSISLEMGALVMTAQAMWDNLKRLSSGQTTSLFGDVKEIDAAIESEYSRIWNPTSKSTTPDASPMRKTAKDAGADAGDAVKKAGEDRKKLEKEISDMQEDARIRALNLEEKITDAERRRISLSAQASGLEDHNARLEAQKKQLEVEKEIYDLKKESADEEERRGKEESSKRNELISLWAAEDKAIRDNKFAASDDKGKISMLQKEREAALKAANQSFAEGDSAGESKRRAEATSLQGEIAALKRGLAEDAQGKLTSLQSRGPTIATSALAEIGGGGGAAIMEKDYARKQVDLLQIIADNTAGSGGVAATRPEPNI